MKIIDRRFLEILAIISGIAGILNFIRGFFPQHGGILLFVFLIPAIFVIVSWLKALLNPGTHLVKPELLSLSVEKEEDLVGRKEVVTNLLRLCRKWTEIHLVGESGSGKTSLLRKGLIPALKKEGNLIPVYLDSWGKDWQETPKNQLCKAIGIAVKSSQLTGLDLPAKLTTRHLRSALRKIKSQSGKTPLIIFDEFDTYIARNQKRLRDLEENTWISPAELIRQNEFWAWIEQLLKEDSIQVLFSVRDTSADGLHPVQFKAPKVFRLECLRSADLIAVFNKMTESGIVSNSEAGWDLLCQELVRDLSVDGWVLPIQMKVVISSLDTLPRLSVKEYQKAGRIRGLEAAFVQRLISGATRTSKLSSGQVSRMLHLLVDHSDKSRMPRTLAELQKEISTMEGVQENAANIRKELSNCLDYWSSRHFIIQRADPDSDESLWILHHQYLVQAILEIDRKQNRLLRLLESKAREFRMESGRPLKMWNALLSPFELLKVVLGRVRGKLKFQGYNGYLSLSLIRFIPYWVLLLLLVLAADARFQFPASGQIRNLLDKQGISLFRDFYSDKDIAAVVPSFRNDFKSMILDRRDPSGWIHGRVNQTGVDYWAHSQALCALFRSTDLSTEELRNLSEGNELLFRDSSGMAVRDTTPYGWLASQGNKIARIEPILWTLGAQCGLYQHYIPEMSRTEFLQKYRPHFKYIFKSLTHYKNSNGGWNLLIGQKKPPDPNIYATTLALQSFLDLKQLLENEHQQFPFISLDDEIQACVKVLSDNFDRDKEGWGLNEINKKTKTPALDLQVFSALLRASIEVGIPLTDLLADVVDDKITNLTVPEEKELFVSQSIKYVNYIDGTTTDSDCGTGFLWFPWAIECSVHWMNYCSRISQDKVKERTAKRTLGYLLVEKLKKEVARIEAGTDKFTFKRSELLYALGTVNDYYKNLSSVNE